MPSLEMRKLRLTEAPWVSLEPRSVSLLATTLASLLWDTVYPRVRLTVAQQPDSKVSLSPLPPLSPPSVLLAFSGICVALEMKNEDCLHSHIAICSGEDRSTLCLQAGLRGWCCAPGRGWVNVEASVDSSPGGVLSGKSVQLLGF